MYAWLCALARDLDNLSSHCTLMVMVTSHNVNVILKQGFFIFYKNCTSQRFIYFTNLVGVRLKHESPPWHTIIQDSWRQNFCLFHTFCILVHDINRSRDALDARPRARVARASASSFHALDTLYFGGLLKKTPCPPHPSYHVIYKWPLIYFVYNQ